MAPLPHGRRKGCRDLVGPSEPKRLAEQGGLAAARLALARWLATAAETQDGRLRSAAIHDAIAWFYAEDDNLAAALRFCAEAGHDDELVAIAGDCAWYWVIRDRNDDAQQWFVVTVPRAADRRSWQAIFIRAAGSMMESFSRGAAPRIDRASIDEIAAEAMRVDHDVVQVMPHIMRAFAAVADSENWMRDVEIPDPASLGLNDWGRAMVTVAQAAMAQNRGDFAVLGAASESAVELFSTTGDRWGMALAQQMRAEWLSLAGRFEEALAMSESSTEAMRAITSSWDLLQLQGLAVNLLVRLGRLDEARERAEQILRGARESDSARAVALACAVSSFLAVELEDVAWARALMVEMEESFAEWEDVPPQLAATAGMARGSVAALVGDVEAAERELRAAAASAVESNDFPIMASAAVAVGAFAARTGRLDEAETALEIATALRGAPDPRNPAEIRIRRALEDARAARPSSERAAIDRDAAASALTQILRR